MNRFRIQDKSIFIFDAFGTLFSTSPVNHQLEKIAGDKTETLLQVWRSKQLQYSWLRGQMKAYVPFNQITKDALQFAMASTGISDPKVFEILLPIYDEPGLIEGAKEMLSLLKSKNKKIAILSNGTLQMLQNGVLKTGIASQVDQLISVDTLGIYKPNPKVYQMALDHFSVPINDLVFFSSNQWDVSGASSFGLHSVWVNQYNETTEVLPFGNVLEVKSLMNVVSDL